MELIVNEKPLSPVEASRLGELEIVIRENLKAWYAVGIAMIEIREQKLYRNDEGRTWEAYCAEVLDMSKNYADRNIAAAKVIENLVPIGTKNDGSVDWELLPANEAQARELSRLEPDEQKQVWGSLVERAKADEQPKITAKAVKNAVSSLKKQAVKEGIDGAKKTIKSASKVDPDRKSEDFTGAWEALMEVIETEHRFGWKTTSRQVVFNTLTRLATVVGECGEQSIRDKKIAFKANNTEKLLAAGFSIFRFRSNMIEQVERDGTWAVYGEYDSVDQCVEAYEDLMLDGKNIQV